MPWLRPRGRRGFSPAAGLAVSLALIASFIPLTAKTKRQRAAGHFQTASSLLADLKAVPQYELGPEQYLLVIRAFRKVWYTSPVSGYCDDSLLAAAHLYQEAADRFSSDRYRRQARETFGFLIKEYPHSKLKMEARVAIEKLTGPMGAKSPTAFAASLDPAPSQALPPSARKTQSPRPANSAGGRESGAATARPPATGQAPAAEPTSAGSRGPAWVKDLRFWSNDDYTRVVIEVDKKTDYKSDRLSLPARLYFDLLGTRLGADLKNSPPLAVNDERIKQIRLGQNRRSTARLVFDLPSPVRYRTSWLSNPPRFVVEVRPSEDNAFVAETIDSPSSDRNPSAALPRPAKAGQIALAKTKHPARRQPVPQSPPAETKAAEQLDGEAIAAADPSKLSATLVSRPVAEAATTTGRGALVAASSGIAANAVAGKAALAPSVALAHVEAEVEQLQPPPASDITTTETEGALARRKPGPQPWKLHRRPADKETPGNAVALSEPPSPAPPAERDAVLLAKAVPPSLPLPPPKPASATLRGKRNLIRALGLKVGRVVIDPGHGGHDTGGVGPNGLREKDLVLDVALRLGTLIEEKMGSEVVYTRTDDRFLSLRQRTKKANRNDADLFVSIHANSSRMRGIRGVETYYLSLTTNSWALAVASRENAAAERSIHELRDLLSKIALTEKIEESREFATHVQTALYKGLASETKGLRDRGVRKAPFMVLLGVEMPAVLAEIGFLSNSRDEKLLKTSAYRQKIAAHLYNGISRYSESLSHTTLARKASSGSARND